MHSWTKRLSDDGYRLILEFEVGSGQSFYNKYLRRPNWPGLESGVTIGIGFDCRFHTRGEIIGDWGEAGLPEIDTSRLATCTGIGGEHAKAMASNLHDIEVPWDAAWWQFNERTIPRQRGRLLQAFPGADLRLNAGGFDALLSLGFNRGFGMGRPNDSSWQRRAQMRNIRDLVVRSGYEQPVLQRHIAAQIRAMVPLWEGTEDYNGMRRRRLAEADLMEKGFV